MKLNGNVVEITSKNVRRKEKALVSPHPALGSSGLHPSQEISFFSWVISVPDNRNDPMVLSKSILIDLAKVRSEEILLYTVNTLSVTTICFPLWSIVGILGSFVE